jgi:hypothetical protein
VPVEEERVKVVRGALGVSTVVLSRRAAPLISERGRDVGVDTGIGT